VASPSARGSYAVGLFADPERKWVYLVRSDGAVLRRRILPRSKYRIFRRYPNADDALSSLRRGRLEEWRGYGSGIHYLRRFGFVP